MSIRACLSVVAAAVTVALSVVIGSSPASASGSGCNPGCTSSVDFKSDGEIFTVHDNKADGYSTAGEFETYTGSSWTMYDAVWDRNGYDGPPKSANYSLPEGTPVRYHACRVEVTTAIFDCGKWFYDHA
jgi:hypothetical protein